MRLPRHSRRIRFPGVAALALLLSGCGLLVGESCVFHCGQETRASTPLVQFLYGEDRNMPARDATVTLNLPIRVGLAFLPPRGKAANGPTAAQRQRILSSIRTDFAGLPYVADIVPLPPYYFDYGSDGRRRDDGMRQVRQLARLQRLDLVALISHDQHETRTMIDLAVIEPNGKLLVLRATGISSEQLIANFRVGLADFENRLVSPGSSRVSPGKRSSASARW